MRGGRNRYKRKRKYVHIERQYTHSSSEERDQKAKGIREREGNRNTRNASIGERMLSERENREMMKKKRQESSNCFTSRVERAEAP